MENVKLDGVAIKDLMQLQEKLQRVPRNAHVTRGRRRCKVTGRSRGVYRKFGMCKSKVREFAMRGEIPGMTKASW